MNTKYDKQLATTAGVSPLAADRHRPELASTNPKMLAEHQTGYDPYNSPAPLAEADGTVAAGSELAD